jgi:hypothetical protein
MGKIVRDRYPELSSEDQEAVRQHAVAAMNVTQQAKLMLAVADAQGGSRDGESAAGSTAFLVGVRKFVNVRDLDIDLIDRINPFETAYSILAKTMDERSLRQVQASIAGKNVTFTEEDARDYAKTAVKFIAERGRAPNIQSVDPWEQKIAQGVAAFTRFKQAAAAQGGASHA